MNQQDAPLWEGIVQYYKAKVIPFHTPGHKLRSGVFPSIEKYLGSIFALDSSDEVEDLAFNNDFSKLLAKAEKLAARAFGAKESIFLVNGTTVGIEGMILPLQGKVVVPRFSHTSVYHGITLSKATPIYLPVRMDPDWHIPVSPSLPEFFQAMEDPQAEAVVVTHPTYYGSGIDLVRLVQAAKQLDRRVLVDEAHGAHFGFSPQLPTGGIEAGADIVVQSTHKVLGSLTGSSMLHSNNQEYFPKVKRAISLLQTTSPSLIMLGVLDEVRRVLENEGRQRIDRVLSLAKRLRTALASIPGVQVVPASLQIDPTKIVFSLRQRGFTGFMVEQTLRRDYNIQLELSDYYNAVALITIGDTDESITSLITAMKDLAARYQNNSPLGVTQIEYPPLPACQYHLAESFYQECERISLACSVGRASFAYLTPYPPGVPLVAPGEVISSEIVEFVKQCLAYSYQVRGVEEEKVWVIKD